MILDIFHPIASRTHTGKIRKNNEDYLATLKKLGFIAIADGMGGHAYGQIASQLAVDACIEYFSEINSASLSLDSESEITNAVSFANEAIITIQRNEDKYRDMGTTLTCAYLSRNKLYYSWVGDSRLYLIRPSRCSIQRLTRDHTLDRAKIDPKLAPDLYKRASSILTQKVGSLLLLQPDSGVLAVEPNDIILACTDGLTDKIDDQWILECINEFKADLEECADRLLDRALDCGGQDNISLILAAISAP
jgi:protein phosphatase